MLICDHFVLLLRNLLGQVLSSHSFNLQVVYILDQVPALEREMLKRIKEQGLDIIPRILIVSVSCTCIFCGVRIVANFSSF